MMKSNLAILASLMLLLITACTLTAKRPVMDAAVAKTEIRKVMDKQADCWSRGDLECYMQGYWKSDSLLFVGSRVLTYGWQQTFDNYKRSYPNASAMGKLTFNLKEMRELAPETILVVGKWHLKRETSEGNLEGHFSVIFKRFKDGWRIVADHSS